MGWFSKFVSVCRGTLTHLFTLLFFFDPQERGRRRHKKKKVTEKEKENICSITAVIILCVEWSWVTDMLYTP